MNLNPVVVHLSRQTILDRQACAEGLDLFDELCAMQGTPGSLAVEWTPLAALLLTATEPSFTLWLNGQNLIPPPDLSGHDLSGMDLSRLNLMRANLRGTNLRGANLRGSYLFGADLTDADLRDADLTDAELMEANLKHADFRGANLFDAQMQGVTAFYTDFRGANLQGAYLFRAILIEPWLEGANLKDAEGLVLTPIRNRAPKKIPTGSSKILIRKTVSRKSGKRS